MHPALWLTPAPLNRTRFMILRMYGDNETEPSVEIPLGRLLCLWLGPLLPDQFAGRLRQPRQRLQLLLAQLLKQTHPPHPR